MYKVVSNLPDGLGAIAVGGVTLTPGAILPDNASETIIKDYLLRELIEPFDDKKPAPAVALKAVPRGLLKPISKWQLNPADLCGKNLTQLNIMILEKDPSAEPFGSMDEAVACLTKDFEE